MDSSDETAEIDADIAALLADPALWAEPNADLEDRVIASINQERNDQERVVVAFPTKRSPWPGRLVAAALGAAAAAVIAVAVRPSTDEPQADAQIPLNASELAPGAAGTARLTSLQSGVQIYFAVEGLPRREGDEFYEGWLKNCDGTKLVPIGTFHELDDATGWAGVSLVDYPILTVTKEVAAAPKAIEQGSSGEVVVSGKVAACPGG